MKRTIKILSTIVIILLFVAIIVFFITNKPQKTPYIGSTENLESITEFGYVNITSPEMNEIAKKYVGTQIESFPVVNSNTNETIDLCDVPGIKIIEVYSSYCNACVGSIPNTSKFTEKHSNLFSFFVVGKEYNSNEKQIFDDEIIVNGYNQAYYYIPGDLPIVYGKMYNTTKPSYIVIDENNTIIEICDGGLNNHKPKEVFGSISDIIVEESDNE